MLLTAGILRLGFPPTLSPLNPPIPSAWAQRALAASFCICSRSITTPAVTLTFACPVCSAAMTCWSRPLHPSIHPSVHPSFPTSTHPPCLQTGLAAFQAALVMASPAQAASGGRQVPLCWGTTGCFTANRRGVKKCPFWWLWKQHPKIMLLAIQFPISTFEVGLGEGTWNEPNTLCSMSILQSPRPMVRYTNTCLTPPLPCKDTHNEKFFRPLMMAGRVKKADHTTAVR